jgi:hypothetical protein
MLADAAEKKIKKENIKMPKFDITKLNVAIDKLLEVIKPLPSFDEVVLGKIPAMEKAD